jgi:type II secretion system protein N
MNTASAWFQDQYKESRFFRGLTLGLVLFFLFFLFASFYYPSKKIQTLLLQTLQDYSPVPFQARSIDFDLLLIPNAALEQGQVFLQPGTSVSFQELAIYPALPSFTPSFIPRASLSVQSDLLEGSLRGGALGSSFSAQADFNRISIAPLLSIIQDGLSGAGAMSLRAKIAGDQEGGLNLQTGDFRLRSSDLQLNSSTIQVPFNGVPLNVSIPMANIENVDIQGTINDNQISLSSFKLGNEKASFQIEGSGTIDVAFRGTSLDLAQSKADLNVGIRVEESFADGVKPISLSDLSRMLLGEKQQPGQWIRFQLKGSLMRPDIGLSKPKP